MGSFNFPQRLREEEAGSHVRPCFMNIPETALSLSEDLLAVFRNELLLLRDKLCSRLFDLVADGLVCGAIGALMLGAAVAGNFASGTLGDIFGLSADGASCG